MFKISFKKLFFYALFCISVTTVITVSQVTFKLFGKKLITIFNETFIKLYPIKHFSNQNDNREKILILSHYAAGEQFIEQVVKNHANYAKSHGYDYWFRGGIIDVGFMSLNVKKIASCVAIFLGLYWQKIIAVKEAMSIMDQHGKPKYDWIMWLDGDAVFTNVDKSLEQLMSEIHVKPKDFFIIAKDMTCCNKFTDFHIWLNSGVFLIRNNQKGRKLIEDIIDSFNVYKDNYYVFPEQKAIQDYVFGLLKRVNNRMVIVEKYNPYKHREKIVPIDGIKVLPSQLLNSGYQQGIDIWKAGNFISHFVGSSKANINDFLECFDNTQDKSKCEYLSLFKRHN